MFFICHLSFLSNYLRFLLVFGLHVNQDVNQKFLMNASVSVVCYKSKTLSNGENPLMLQISKDGKRKYQSLGISVNPLFWDFTKNQPKRNCPNKEQIERLILEKKKAFAQTILELSTTQKDYTTNSLLDKVDKPFIKQTVDGALLNQIEQMGKEQRLNYSLSFQYLYSSFRESNTNLLG